LTALAKVLQVPRAARALEKGEPLEEAQLFVGTALELVQALERRVAQIRTVLNRLRKHHPSVRSLSEAAKRFAPLQDAIEQAIRDVRNTRL